MTIVSAADAAKPYHHHKPAAPAADAASDLRAEVDALKAQVNALEAREDQDSAARQQTQAQVEQLQGQLAEANQRATRAEQQVEAQIQTIPGEVQTQVAKAQPKAGWWANTSVSGRMYWDLTNIDERSNIGNAGLSLGNASQTATSIPSGDLGHNPSGVNFDIKRFYVSVDHTFNKTFSADITTDFLYDYLTKSTQLYIKKAYLQAKVSDGLIFQVGSADQPWIPFDEDVYGYRYVENTLIDRTKFGTSADWGVHVLGKLPIAPDLTFAYNVSVTNGMGYKIPGFIGGANRSNAMDFEGRANLNYKGFVVAVGGYDGKLGTDYSGGVQTFHDAERFDALAAYSDKWGRLGFEYMWANSYVSSGEITSATTPDSSTGYEVFGNFNFTPQLSLFGRYDWVMPRSLGTTAAPASLPLAAIRNNYYNIGLQWEPAKIVDFALVYKHDAIDNGAFGDQNFTTVQPTTTGSIPVKGSYDEIGVWGQFRW